MIYEVGAWFIYLVDAAIIALLFAVGLIVIFIQKGRYQKQAKKCIQVEIIRPTGWSSYYTPEINDNAKTIEIDNFIYVLDTEKRRWSLHPRNPIMNLSWLQAPIRKASFFQDRADEVREDMTTPIATAMEIQAISREIQATTAAMQIQEIEARQDELTKAILNQPAKAVVYVLMGFCTVCSAGALIIVAQMAGIVGGA